MGSIHEVIEALRKEPTNSERGTKFEQLMVRYFEPRRDTSNHLAVLTLRR
jgi:predicted helicase